MLILTRRINGDREIEVTIFGIRGNQVKLGINAPKEVSVHRKEIYEKILREKKIAERLPNMTDTEIEEIEGLGNRTELNIEERI